jgi:arylsulfatase
MNLRVLFFLAIIPLFASAKPLEGSRPNIILVMTDDQGIGDFSCMGNPILKTPNVDRFYAKAYRFTDFHVSPTCAPTRSAIMSGRHEFRNGVTHTIYERERMSLETTTFPQLLQENGYKTAIVGKWHLGDEDAYQPYNRGFDEVFIHGAGGIGQHFPKSSCSDFPPNWTNRYTDAVFLHNDTIVQSKGFCTDVFFREALGWVKGQLAGKQPFFLYLVPNAPHSPMLAPESYTQRFVEMGWDKRTAGRYGMIENLDDNFGLLIEKLEEWQALDNTLVVFMTDNGSSFFHGKAKMNGKKTDLFNGHYRTGKGSAYEGGTHVPAFWYWKGHIEGGVDIPALTAHIDLYKTICELSGTALPAGIQPLDGRSLLPLLENPKSAWPDRDLFIQVGRWKEGENADDYRETKFAVRTQQWRLVAGKKGLELYDILNDPYEAKDVASRYPEVAKQLQQKHVIWWKKTRPLMINEEAYKHPVQEPQVARYYKQLKERGIPKWIPPEI